MHPKLIAKLNKADLSQEQMLAEIAEGNYTLLSYKPNQDSWNILEVVEHCQNIETSILYSLIKYKDYPSKQLGMTEAMKFSLLRLALLGGLRFKVPPIKGLLPEGEASPEKLRTSWKQARAELMAFLENFPHAKMKHSVFKHPRAGYINILQTIAFIHDHTMHHLNQIKRIKKSYLKTQKTK